MNNLAKEENKINQVFMVDYTEVHFSQRFQSNGSGGSIKTEISLNAGMDTFILKLLNVSKRMLTFANVSKYDTTLIVKYSLNYTF